MELTATITYDGEQVTGKLSLEDLDLLTAQFDKDPIMILQDMIGGKVRMDYIGHYAARALRRGGKQVSYEEVRSYLHTVGVNSDEGQQVAKMVAGLIGQSSGGEMAKRVQEALGKKGNEEGA